ncbi:hypothetical protein EJ05DRAFT_509225 [Pseudovirgaria hyperparasitica]|uniref:DUF7924 domain-containing protein n=1 Tax=Pseudovirgaria hyperparasitica TaxID=470096 RepID=A0A6A6WBQ8_9PEZI|nr:uncharacterized protein EJ05DRAFT_509225 [Pseudovirgaria hyperparasitica]KAF2759474.1 hypothetical protein EJ05DRAFT_509225 [Pseudovirgaria hyperparasitica]
MASYSPPLAAPKRRCIQEQAKAKQPTSEATSPSNRKEAAAEERSDQQTDAQLQARHPTKQQASRQRFPHCKLFNMVKDFSSSTEAPSRVVEAKKRSWDPESHTSSERPRKRLQSQISPNTKQAGDNRHREDEVPNPRDSLEASTKRSRSSSAATQKTIKEARLEFWRDKGTWPTEEQEATMRRLQDIVDQARPIKRSLSRKRSNASLNSETTQTQTSSSQLNREQKSAPYKHPMFVEQMRVCGSFLSEHTEGITTESKRLCQMLLNGTQSLPEGTLFSDDYLFDKTCKRMNGENEARVVRDIALLIVPSAEILADRGAKHLEVLRETVNACWLNSATFLKPPGSRPGPRPQPDYGLGFRSDAFSIEQYMKLLPFLGNLVTDSGLIAATFNMYLPFFSAEVKSGAADLDVADRQNAHTQTVCLRGLYTLFRLVGREKELHREVNGFSISHNYELVRIWGHYAVIDGDNVKYYRHKIHTFSIGSDGNARWTAYTFVRNLYDLWLPKHFERICEVIDALPADVNFDVSEQGSDPASTRSGVPQSLESHGGPEEEEEAVPDTGAAGSQAITPGTTIETDSAQSKKAKTSS